MDCIHVAHCRVHWGYVIMVMKLWVPQKAGNMLTSLVAISFS